MLGKSFRKSYYQDVPNEALEVCLEYKGNDTEGREHRDWRNLTKAAALAKKHGKYRQQRQNFETKRERERNTEPRPTTKQRTWSRGEA